MGGREEGSALSRGPSLRCTDEPTAAGEPCLAGQVLSLFGSVPKRAPSHRVLLSRPGLRRGSTAACLSVWRASLLPVLHPSGCLPSLHFWQAWVKARQGSDFSQFAPVLQEWVDLRREKARLVDPSR